MSNIKNNGKNNGKNETKNQNGASCETQNVGGQAVMEGVMMRLGGETAVTVRRPDGTMVTSLTHNVPLKDRYPWMGKPFIRGAVNMVTMLYYGMNTLNTSTQMLGVLDEEPTKFEKWLSKKLGKGIDKIVMAVAIILAVVMSVGLFIAIPAAVESLLMNANVSVVGYTLAGGLVKIAILIGYMIIVAKVPEIHRTFQYHGAEHKSVHCHEAGVPLTPENAQKYSRLHPRCGTAFLLIVFSISILLFLVLNVVFPIKNYFVRLLFHLAMLPIVAGTSYEVLMGLAHSESKIAHILRWPGLQMQRLTTREPELSMLECAIISVNVVLYGMPKHVEKTPEGWGIFHNYYESERFYVPPKKESTDKNDSAEGTAAVSDSADGAAEGTAAVSDSADETASAEEENMMKENKSA